MKKNIIYIATERHPGCICFLDQDGDKKEFKISAKLWDKHTQSISALLTCDNIDHRGASRAEDTLEVAIHEYHQVHNVLPEHIELSWYGMVSNAPSTEDIQIARTNLGLKGVPFSGILNTTSHILLKIGLFATIIAPIAAYAYQSYQEKTPR